MLLKPGKHITNNLQANLKELKTTPLTEYFRPIKSTYHFINYFHCSVPARK